MGLLVIIGLLVLILAGGWALWRVFSGRTRTPVAETLEDEPDREQFSRQGEPAVGVPVADAADRHEVQD